MPISNKTLNYKIYIQKNTNNEYKLYLKQIN